VIAHLFWPEVDYCYEMTHSYANIYYDTSGLADRELIAATGFDRIEAVLLKTLAQDPKRVVFGTDYAMCNRPDHIAMVNQLPISEEVRANIFWRNAVELFKLPVVAANLA
jgi:predicted TIM-barrel fold metal-dependent hydrolase